MSSLHLLIREYTSAGVFVEFSEVHSSTRLYECKCGRTIQRYSIREHLRTLNHREWWRSNRHRYPMVVLREIEEETERRTVNDESKESPLSESVSSSPQSWNEQRNHQRTMNHSSTYELVRVSDLDQNSPSILSKPEEEECGICYEKKTSFLCCKVCKNTHCDLCGVHIQKCPFCRSDFGVSMDDKIFIYKLNYYWNFFKNEPNPDSKCMSLYALCRIIHKYKHIFTHSKYNTTREILRLTLIEEFHTGFESGVFFIALLGLNNQF